MSVMQDMGARAMALGIPLSVQLDLTYRCNERCVHCYLDHEDHGEMTTAEIMGLLDQLAAAGVFFLNVSGGEIFMRPDLFTIIEHARKLQFSVKLKTNGVMIREKKAQRIAELGIEAVQISLYSHDAATHDEITKLPGSFKRTIEGAQFLRDAGVKVIFANVLMSQNADHYKQVQALAHDMGIRYEVDATITPMMDGDRGIVALNMDAGRLAGWVAARGEGERNRGLFWASCRLAEAGLSAAEAHTALGAAAEHAGLPAPEIAATIRSAYRAVTVKPLPVTAPATGPHDAVAAEPDRLARAAL